MKKSQLHQIKRTGHKAPETYFDTFEERLFAKMEVQDAMASLKDSGHKVPKDYFENFDSALLLGLKKRNDSKLRTLFSWRNTTYVTGIAAALLIMFGVFLKSSNPITLNQVETAAIEDYLNNEDLNIYEITALLTAEDIASKDFVPNTISEESLENYLLNNASIEDLIAEK